MNQTSRILMNEADGSPGGGAVAADPVAPTAAPTAPESPASLTADAVANIVSATIEGKLKAFENGLFASARKAGLLGKDKPSVEHPSPSPTPQQAPGAPTPAAATGLSMADVEAMLEQERVLTRAATEHKLTDAQVRRMKSALKSERPDDSSLWAATYLADMGFAKAGTPTPAIATQPVQTQAAAPAAKPNISDRGTASPTDTRDSEGVLNSRPLEMTGRDVEELTLKYGHDKGMQMFQERVLSALSKVRIKPPRG